MNRFWVWMGAGLVWLACSASASARAHDVYLWPVLTVDKDDSGSDVRFVIPLGQFTEKDAKTIKAFRPVFILERAEHGNRSLDIFWPWMEFERNANGDLSNRVFPLFWKAERDGGRRATLFPVLWAWWDGKKSPEKIRGVVLGPLWNVQSYKEGEEWSRGVAPVWWTWRKEEVSGLWMMPVYRRTTDNGDDKAFGVLPFYFERKEEDKCVYWVLPVYWSREGDDLDAFLAAPFFWWKDQGRQQIIFPFYGRFQDEESEWISVLGPVYMRETEGEYRQHRVLWPMLTWGSDGRENWEFSLWPFFGRTREQGMYQNGRKWERERNYSLWPIFHWGSSERDREKAGLTQREYFNIFPLFWSGNSETRSPSRMAEGDSLEIETRRHHHWLLPLYTYNENPDGKRFTMLWPIWRHASSGEESRYSVLWRIFDARFHQDGGHRVSVLWRAYRNEAKGETRIVDVFPFLSYRKTAADTKRISFLAGLFEWGVASGDRYMRLLYLPKLNLAGSKQ